MHWNKLTKLSQGVKEKKNQNENKHSNIYKKTTQLFNPEKNEVKNDENSLKFEGLYLGIEADPVAQYRYWAFNFPISFHCYKLS